MAATPPQVAADRLDDWECVEVSVDTLFSLPVVAVEGYTLVYEDAPLRERFRTATGEPITRFFFATRLAFVPALSSRVEALLQPTVASAAQGAFADQLDDRGLSTVTREGRQRLTVDSGKRASATVYTASYEWDGMAVPIEGLLAVWRGDGFTIAGGAYPSGDDDLGVEVDAERYESALIELIGGVA
ncbi:hypothetical protein SAMN06269185_1958 [Natronoarchaeum philippinense]|uniref:Uncharacterized protein n=1 Tax=Natronoarchaeum philippinense TaxID=558529 RepID=A0A285NTM8_NATPI|nr:hypothetical protein [Natronoarchaeum philippinense]SNZ12854.1 hypothetical protein SAMN06269185_1958 [Natronoarchaeum philippinense]